MSISFFVEEMARFTVSGRRDYRDDTGKAVTQVISDAVVENEREASDDEKWIRVTDVERGVIYHFQISAQGD